MKAICYLDGIRQNFIDCTGIGAGPVSGDYRDIGMLLKPSLESFAIPCILSRGNP
jgi:hypothetical protein